MLELQIFQVKSGWEVGFPRIRARVLPDIRILQLFHPTRVCARGLREVQVLKVQAGGHRGACTAAGLRGLLIREPVFSNFELERIFLTSNFLRTIFLTFF